MKNLIVRPDGDYYNFGIRKPVLNCKELLSNHPWEEFLINKWVYMYDKSEGRNIYIKHVFRNSRIIQVIYSGLDILGDGTYILYKAKVKHLEDKKFMVIPDEFALLMGSFECEDYLKKLLEEKYMTEEEYQIFNNKKALDEFAQNLVFMPI